MKQFEVNKTYSTRSVCDYDCIITLKVTKRTAKTVTTDEGKTLRIFQDSDGNEAVKPWGSYSMAPVIRASRVAA